MTTLHIALYHLEHSGISVGMRFITLWKAYRPEVYPPRTCVWNIDFLSDRRQAVLCSPTVTPCVPSPFLYALYIYDCSDPLY